MKKGRKQEAFQYKHNLMILDINQIKAIIKAGTGPLINQGVKYNKRMRCHLFGDDKDAHISLIKNYEREDELEMRKKHTPSNKDLFARLCRPKDKVYSARGGSIYYNLSDSLEKKARQLSANVRDGYSIKDWLRSFWDPQSDADPYGIILMELVSPQQAALFKKTGESFTYPTYQPITSVLNYKPKGNRFDWIVFNALSKDQLTAAGIDPTWTVYRVIDDANDYFIRKSGEDQFLIMTEYTFPNFFGYVPAIRNSDIDDPTIEGGVLSFFDRAIELAENFMIKRSMKAMHDFKHGFAKYAGFADDCPECKGEGEVSGRKCEKCKGSGSKLITKVSEMKLLKWPESKDTPVILPTDSEGYIEPSKTYHEIYMDDSFNLENAIAVTSWGSQSKLKTQGMSTKASGDSQTATEIMSDIKPESDRLKVITEMYEKRYKFILDAVVKINLMPTGNYPGSSVKGGTRYMIEGPDAVWEKYLDAKAKGAPANSLYDLLQEYNEEKFADDQLALLVANKLMYVEPWVHLTIQQVQSMNPSEEDLKAKMYFSQWLSVVKEGELIFYDISQLQGKLYEYSNAKTLPQPAQKQLQNAA